MSFLDETDPIDVAILGSTGSIGRQALDVVRSHPDRFRVVALAAGSDSATLKAQAEEFGVQVTALASGDGPPGAIVGPDAAEKIVGETNAQVVLNAVVGAAGLKATLATIASGKTLALANKESLVAAGEQVMAKAAPGQIRPVDSEHSALWQVLEGIPADQVRRIIITGSGGPFRGRDIHLLQDVTVAQALAHPVWDMGPKISIDSATLMNKGLEVIEAHFLFGFTYDEIDVVIHPQGLIHGMVEAFDGSMFAHAAEPDMRLPIQVALGWPERISPPSGKRFDPMVHSQLTFEAPDLDTFRCLSLAYEAGKLGDTYPAVLNAANEVSVSAFLDGKIPLVRIPELIEKTMAEHEPCPPDLDGVLSQDEWARARTSELIGVS